MVELAAVSTEAGETRGLLCKGISLELPLGTLFEGASMLVFLRPGVLSFQVSPPSAVDSRRPLLKAQPWVVSLNARLSNAALLGISEASVASVWVTFPPGRSFMRVRAACPESFGARAWESAAVNARTPRSSPRLTQLSKCHVSPPSFVENKVRVRKSSPASAPGSKYVTHRTPLLLSLNTGGAYWAAAGPLLKSFNTSGGAGSCISVQCRPPSWVE